jgi:hypothetical protein
MRKILIFTLSLFVCSCGDSELTKFNNRVSIIQTISESEGLSNNILSSYIDSVMIIKAQISVSKVVNSEKDSLNKKLSSIYNDLRVSRAYNCMTDKTVKRTNSYNNRGDKVMTKVDIISKDSAKISQSFSMSENTSFLSFLSDFSGKKNNFQLPKNNEYKVHIDWISSTKDDKLVLIFIPPKEGEEANPYDITVINVNDVECKYKIEL